LRGFLLTAVEKDSRFAFTLNRLGDVKVICGDILDFDFQSLTDGTKVIANIPYHLTSPILEKIIQSKRVKTAVLMVQKEVAIRIVAAGGSKDFGPLSLFVQLHAKPTLAFVVGANCFYPKPSVDSAVIRLDFYDDVRVPDLKKFEEVTRCAFQQRRKRISSTLRDYYPQERIQEILQQMNKPKEARPEELTTDEWISFFTALHSAL
jgi:16S rRNA (adenine1518-N6/adenine1519-N6)-dimethyltransferase